VRPWIKVRYPEIPAVGRIEAAYFQPDRWKPEYPNPAFDNMRGDDAFWAGRRLVAFSDDLIRSAVNSGQFTDPEAELYLAQVLITRRDKILLHWLNGVLPVVDPALDADGTLTFRNVAVEVKAAQPAREYRVRWFAFDNATQVATPFGEESVSPELTARAPAALLAGRPAFVLAEIRGSHAMHAAWSTPLKVYFRRHASGWQTVGIERQ
jgi:hypothetical protein